VTPQAFALAFVLPVLALALVLSAVRLLRGPSLPDRVVALDLMTTLAVGLAAAAAIVADQAVILDVALVLALVAFLGTLAFAHYVERSR